MSRFFFFRVLTNVSSPLACSQSEIGVMKIADFVALAGAVESAAFGESKAALVMTASRLNWSLQACIVMPLRAQHKGVLCRITTACQLALYCVSFVPYHKSISADPISIAKDRQWQLGEGWT
eukprot:1151606-Pelagomonas_calceolata.AAC.2